MMCNISAVCLSVLVFFVTVDSVPFGSQKPSKISPNTVKSLQKIGQLLNLAETQSQNHEAEMKSTLDKTTKVETPPGNIGFGNIEIRTKRDTEKSEKALSKKEIDGMEKVVEQSTKRTSTNKLSNMDVKEIKKLTVEVESTTKHLTDVSSEKVPGKERIAPNQDSQPPQQKTRTFDNATFRDLPTQDYVFYASVKGSLKLHRAPAVWTDARLVCYDEGAELASPENEALLVAISAVLLTSRQPPLHIFTGVNDLYSKGFFTSLRGTPLSVMPAQWAPREPDNVNHGTNCLVMQRNGLLLDSKCDDVYPFICYKRQEASLNNLCGTMETGYVYDRHTNSCHKIHAETDASWQEAYATCAREGGYLAVISSDYEAKTLTALTKRWAHIGISYWRKDLWMTIHGQTLSEAGFDSWASGEPNDVNEERCGCLSDYGFLVDIDCEYHPLPFICEKSV